jgi:hypothetical protein
MKKGRPSTKGSLSSLINKSNNYHSYYQEKNANEIIINLDNLKELINLYSKKDSVSFNDSDDAVIFLNNCLKEYLKNIIQQLIEHNRRRTYSRYISFSKQNKIISYGINVQRDENPSINAKKNKFYPKKDLTLMCSINVDKKLNLLNQYNALKNNKIYKIENDEKRKNSEKDENSDSSSDFFQKKRKNSDDDDNDNKKEYEGIMNVYQSHELTTNKKFLKKNKISRVELKDLIFYLEDNQTVPWNKRILFKAYTEMTSGNK